MNDQDRALAAFENALRHNPNSILGLNAVASIMRGRDNFDKAIEYFQRILNIKQDNGEVWGSMGECGVSRTLLTPRPLPADEGRPAKGVHRLPASALPLAQPQSMS
jgi:tetratricopeptide (TPR) repeat protein